MEQLFDDLDDFGSFDDVVSGNVRDPFPELARLRREEPVQRIEGSNMPGEAGLPVFFIVYRFEEAQQMLRDNETFFSSSGVIAAFGPVLGERVMLGMDEPVHGRLRALISKAFSQKSLARFQDELVARVGNELIDAFAANGKADLVKEFTFTYPSRIIAGLLGLPEEDYPQFQRWSISLLSWIMNPERGLAASAALVEYYRPILEARRAEPRDDLISLLAAAEIDGGEVGGRGDLLVPTAAVAGRCRNDLPVARKPVVRVAVRPGSARRCSQRPLAAAAGDRGGRAVESAAADHHSRRNPGHRTGWGADPGGRLRDADAGCGEPAGRSFPPRPGQIRHLP